MRRSWQASQLDRLISSSTSLSRRSLLRTAVFGAAAVVAKPIFGARNWSSKEIAIVGGGLAGLVCADTLRSKGFSATIYEAADHLGGRCLSLRGTFPGQVVELGGELIDNLHKTMLGYANEFGLAKEDIGKEEGEIIYHVLGQTYHEAAVVEQYRILSKRMQKDLRKISGEPSARNHTDSDVDYDNLSLSEYLDTRAADLPLIRKVIEVAYVAEYGLEAAEQSCLGFLLFIHADRRSKFTPYGVFSDERYHLVNGNDGVVHGIADRLSGPIELGARLTRLSKNGSGKFVLEFDGDSAEADAVVMTVPFSVLRNVDLDASLGLTAEKRNAIDTLGYGANAKTMYGFNGRPWAAYGSNGTVYSDLPNLQVAWETNAANAGPNAVLTDYSSGVRGANLAFTPTAGEIDGFLSSLEIALPGTQAAASGLVVRKDWPSEPLHMGSYTCYRPGQFTTVAGIEAEPAGLLKFAGEHADSFYSWQGFMEGACLSGIRAAKEILADIKSGAL